MAIRPIIKYPDPRLKQKAEPVSELTEEIATLLNDMAETMYAAPGIGLAAPQIAVLKRVIVVDVGEDEESGQKPLLYKLINPEITHKEGKIVFEEGCLSIPGIKEKVQRADRVILRATNEKAEDIEIDATGLLAVCFQHELDHLDGVLFIDRLSQLKKQMIRSQLAKRSREE